MARLALLAMLLLAALPTAGRFAASLQGETGWAGLCTSAGLKRVQVGGDHAGAPTTTHGDDCAYCPLLSALDAPVAVPMLLSPPASHPAFAAGPAAQRPVETPLSGLGARGPPRVPDAIA
jgi:hypothetical protein